MDDTTQTHTHTARLQWHPFHFYMHNSATNHATPPLFPSSATVSSTGISPSSPSNSFLSVFGISHLNNFSWSLLLEFTELNAVLSSNCLFFRIDLYLAAVDGFQNPFCLKIWFLKDVGRDVWMFPWLKITSVSGFLVWELIQDQEQSVVWTPLLFFFCCINLGFLVLQSRLLFHENGSCCCLDVWYCCSSLSAMGYGWMVVTSVLFSTTLERLPFCFASKSVVLLIICFAFCLILLLLGCIRFLVKEITDFFPLNMWSLLISFDLMHPLITIEGPLISLLSIYCSYIRTIFGFPINLPI